MSKLYVLWLRIEEYDSETKKYTSDPDILVADTCVKAEADKMAEWVDEHIEDALRAEEKTDDSPNEAESP